MRIPVHKGVRIIFGLYRRARHERADLTRLELEDFAILHDSDRGKRLDKVNTALLPYTKRSGHGGDRLIKDHPGAAVRAHEKRRRTLFSGPELVDELQQAVPGEVHEERNYSKGEQAQLERMFV